MQSFTVACCQVRAYDLSDAEANLQNLLSALDDAGQRGAKLVGLPECAYPAYYVGDADPYARPGVRPFSEVCELFAAKARQHGYWLAAGMAVPHGPGRLTNSAVVFSPEGVIVGRYDKSFLWHFDTTWFERGAAFPVFDAGFCRFGVLICADGRQPEIARSLKLNGAEVILDLTAWVSWGRTVDELSTPQCEYMMPVRAFENGVWVAAADKWGPEAGSIIYAGRSCVIDPEGAILVAAPSDRDAIVSFEIEPREVERPRRRPSLYGRLVEPTEHLPVTRLMETALVPSRENHRVAIMPGDRPFDAVELASRYSALRAQGADLVVAAGMTGPDGWQGALPTIEATVRNEGGAFAFAVATDGCVQSASAVLVTPEHTYEHVATHGTGAATGELNAEVVHTPAGNIALVCGEEGFVPEVARSLALEGADIIAWPAFAAHEMTERIARCRSDENRIYTAVAWPGGGLIVSPAGAVLTAVPAGTGIAMAAQVNPVFSRWKDMAPGTNVIFDRQPQAYGALVR